jgi:hypothetical protein
MLYIVLEDVYIDDQLNMAKEQEQDETCPSHPGKPLDCFISYIHFNTSTLLFLLPSDLCIPDMPCP